MLEIKIEKAQLSNAAELLDLQKLAFRSEAEIHQDFRISPLIETLETYRSDFSNHHYFKATLNNVIIASVRGRLTDENRLLIGRLIVHPDYQNQGIGKKLMGFIENEFREANEYELFTAERSSRNMTFYKRLGYEVVEKFREPANEKVILVRLRKKPEGN